MEGKRDTDRIADEAVGQTHGTPPPAEARERQTLSPEEAARKNAPAPDARASMAEKTAASLGERAGDAYADSASVAGTSSGSRPGMADRALSAGQHMAQGVSDQFSDQRFVSIIAAFGLGFIAAVLLQRRR